MTAKQHIEALMKSKSSPGPNTATVASVLGTQMKELFHAGHNFIHELLQNADDAGAVSLEFRLQQDRLIIFHDGKPFEYNDVERICDISRNDAAETSEKNHMQHNTGYKDIGFKAVFIYSHKVIVISKDYCFRFDKAHWELSSQNKIPWQIIPVWSEAGDYLHDPNKVNFILELTNVAEVKRQLDLFIKQPETTMFLRNIKNITVDINGMKHYIQREAIDQTWLKHDFFVETTADFRTSLANTNDFVCPPKIKNKKKCRFTFAISKAFEMMTGPSFYCYLPTGVISGFPFLVNTDFLLSPDRATITNNIWNQFLMESIAKSQFEWLKVLAQDQTYRKHVLNLLGDGKVQNIALQLQDKYRECFEKSLQDIAFIPSIGGGTVKVKDCIIDDTGFFSEFPELAPRNSHHCIKIVEPTLQGLADFREKHNVTIFGWNNLASKMNEYMKKLLLDKDDKMRCKVLHYIIKNASDNIHLFFHEEILLTTQGMLARPSECFLAKPNEPLCYPAKESLKIIDVRQYTKDVIHGLKNILRVAVLTSSSYLQIFVANLIDRQLLDPNLSLDILRFVYHQYTTVPGFINNITPNKKTKFDLSLFPVMTRANANEMIILRNVFLPMEDGVYITEDVIISDNYFKDNDDMDEWRTLLASFGVQTECKLILHDTISYDNVQRKMPTLVKKIFDKYLCDVLLCAAANKQGQVVPPGQMYPSQIQTAKHKFTFINYANFDILFNDKIKVESRLLLFLQAIKNNREVLDVQPKLNRGVQKPGDVWLDQQFLVYYFRSYFDIPVVGQERYLPPEELLYNVNLTTSFSSLNMDIAFAELPSGIELMAKEAEFLGFRTNFEVEELLGVLRALNIAHGKGLDFAEYIEKLHSLYTMMIEMGNTASSYIEKWKEKNTLLALDQQLKPAKNLRMYDLVDDNPQSKKHWLNHTGFSASERIKLAEFLCLPRISQEKKFTKKIAEDIEGNADKLKNFVLTILPFAILRDATIRSSGSGGELTLYQKAAKYILKMDFVYCDEITVELEGVWHHRALLGDNDNTLYFCGRFSVKSLQDDIANSIKHLVLQTEKGKNIFSDAMQYISDLKNLDEKIKKMFTAEEIEKQQKMLELLQGLCKAEAAASRNSEVDLLEEQMGRVDLNDSDENVLTSSPQFESSSSKDTPVIWGTLETSPKAPVPISEKSVYINHEHEKINSKTPLPPPGNRTMSAPKVTEPRLSDEEQRKQDKKNKATGDEGERLVYEKIKQVFIGQLCGQCNGTFKDHHEGMTFMTKNNVEVNLKWFNKSRNKLMSDCVRESPIDLVIAVAGKDRYFIEVKSTISDEKANPYFFLTSNEWQYMRTYGTESVLVRVYDTDTDKPAMKFYKNPFQMIVNDILKFATGGKFRMNVQEDTDMQPYSLLGQEDKDIGCKFM